MNYTNAMQTINPEKVLTSLGIEFRKDNRKLTPSDSPILTPLSFK
jgi:hypothetical protein